MLLQACVKRIQGDESGHKHCTGQYFDYWSCIDKCVSVYSLMQELFSQPARWGKKNIVYSPEFIYTGMQVAVKLFQKLK